MKKTQTSQGAFDRMLLVPAGEGERKMVPPHNPLTKPQKKKKKKKAKSVKKPFKERQQKLPVHQFYNYYK